MPSEAVHRLLFENTQLPVLQNRTYETQQEARACAKGDVRLVEDLRSGLVYNAAFRPEIVVYDDDYQNEQVQSPSFYKHLDAVAEIVGRCLWREGLVEVGCGKGSFLEMLTARGFDIEGFDPAYDGENPRIRNRAFDGALHVPVRGIILRHVLEHIQDPVEFLFEIRRANGGEGRIYIEVPCFDWICEHRAWFDIFYEHVNYFRMADFNRLFGTVLESGHLFSGQHLYVVAELASLRAPVYESSEAVLFPQDFARGIGESGRRQSKHAAIWGGASKGVVFALLKERAGQPVEFAIDINPAKQRTYLPGTGLLVESPSAAMARLSRGSTVFVMNSNYLSEIRQMSDNAFDYVEVES